VVDGSDQGGVKCLVLHGGRFPEQKGIDVEGDVVVKEGNGEVDLLLSEGQAVIIVEPRSEQGHFREGGCTSAWRDAITDVSFCDIPPGGA
jgi:hypothetical protein